MRVGSGFGIMDPIKNKETGPSIHHHLSAALGVSATEDLQSGAGTPQDSESVVAEDDMKMEMAATESITQSNTASDERGTPP